AGAVAQEDAPCAPRTAYGADKLGSELHARVATLVHGVPTLGMRFFNVYGPRQDPSSPYSGVVSIFAARLARGLPVTLHGDGTQTRDFVHVGDVVAHLRAAMALLAREGGSGVLNVCTGRETSVRDLAATLGAVFGVAPEITHGPARAGDIARSLGDPARATAALGVAAGTRLEAGLAAMREQLAGE
nr:NAD-dependent epimerase/dehydratase family protein [Rhodospirillales bacterium]